MKKAILALIGAAFISSCAMPEPVGTLYTDVKVPVTATNASGNKVGKATATSILNLIATGNASVEAAKRNGGISTVSTVDREVKSILGIYSTYTTTVTGN